MNLNNLSKNIFVINLKERIDRKNHIVNELKKIDCSEYNFIEGINGNEIFNNTNLSNGMFGLVKTYLKIYEIWKKTNAKEILIIEDDCKFVNDFNKQLDLYIKNIPNDWEMIYFGANHNYHMGFKTQKINEYCVKLNNSFSAHCVLLRDYVFEDLINRIKNFTIENDVMMANLQRKYNAYSSNFALATQIESFSNIENKIVNYNWLIK